MNSMHFATHTHMHIRNQTSAHTHTHTSNQAIQLWRAHFGLTLKRTCYIKILCCYIYSFAWFKLFTKMMWLHICARFNKMFVVMTRMCVIEKSLDSFTIKWLILSAIANIVLSSECQKNELFSAQTPMNTRIVHTCV